jgi:hypothetical protein
VAWRPEAAPATATSASVSQEIVRPGTDASSPAPISLAYQVPADFNAIRPDSAPGTHPALTPQESQVGRLATGYGDRDFLMVDKALGRIILFQGGSATFSGAALTGQSTLDRLPTGAMTEKFAQLTSLDTKVTPAGRYTVARNTDKNYGPLFDVNEIKGKDWGIAIHKVYLGTPSEHREARLRSPSEDVKHITFGCINVAPETIEVLLRELPASGPIPLYILPEDQAHTTEYFNPRTS